MNATITAPRPLAREAGDPQKALTYPTQKRIMCVNLPEEKGTEMVTCFSCTISLALITGPVCALLALSLRPVRVERDWPWRGDTHIRRPALHRRRF